MHGELVVSLTIIRFPFSFWDKFLLLATGKQIIKNHNSSCRKYVIQGRIQQFSPMELIEFLYFRSCSWSCLIKFLVRLPEEKVVLFVADESNNYFRFPAHLYENYFSHD